MLGVVAQQCWVRLYVAWGSLELRHVSLPHLRVVLLLNLCSVKKIKGEWFFVIPNTFSYGKIIQMSVEDQRSSFVFALKENTRSLFCVWKTAACKSCTPTRNISLNTVIIKKRATFGGKGTDRRKEDRKTGGGWEASWEILKRFIRLCS